MTCTSRCPSLDLGVLIHKVGVSGGNLTGGMLAHMKPSDRCYHRDKN